MEIARIKCGKTPYMLPAGAHTGTNLRAFFGVKDSDDLWWEGEDGDIRIDDSDVPLTVGNGDRFFIAAKEINGGG